MESGVSLYSYPNPQKPDTITAPNQDSDEAQYLTKIANKISALDPMLQDISPFEHIDPTMELSFAKPVRLDPSAIYALENWVTDRYSPDINIIGAVNLAVIDPGNYPWQRALQLRIPSIRVPLLGIHVYSLQQFEQERFEISLRANSTVWLRHANGLDGLIGPQQADENLGNLASLTRLIVDQGNDQLESAQIHIDGSIFRKESERIKDAFSGFLYPLSMDLD